MSTPQGPGMQFIVISLKTGFFQGSEALVGVYRDQSANSSKVLTLDVSHFSSVDASTPTPFLRVLGIKVEQ
jgi:hypothetical protein